MDQTATAAPATDRPEPPFDDRLAVVLLPGTLCDARVFEPALQAFAGRKSQVINTLGEDTTETLARRILARAPPRFLLAGFSLGGMVALEIAARAPDRIAGLILIATSARPLPAGDAVGRMAQTDEAQRGGLAPFVIQQLWPRYVAAAARDDVALQNLIVDMAETLGPQAFRQQTLVALSRADSRPRLPALTMPILVLGGEDDAVCPPDFSREIAAAAPNATLRLVAGAGHFVLLEAPQTVTAHLTDWLGGLSGGAGAAASRRTAAQGIAMDSSPPQGHENRQDPPGFDNDYADIADYVVRSTDKIWRDRNIGLIYSHYTHNCVAYGALETTYSREDIVRETLRRMVELPDQQDAPGQVIWRGAAAEGFYASHLETRAGRHTEYGGYGAPTGRPFCVRSITDSLIVDNRIYRQWAVRDTMALVIQLGLDPHDIARARAIKAFERGQDLLEIGENRRMIGQYPPETQADLSLAHTDGEARLLQGLHQIYNARMFGEVHEVYAPDCAWRGPLMRELSGAVAVQRQILRLVAMIPDGALTPLHICSTPSEDGGEAIAMRWIMDGHHLGYGDLGAPTGHRLSVMGASHFHLVDGKIAKEWTVYDGLALLAQIKLAALATPTQDQP